MPAWTNEKLEETEQKSSQYVQELRERLTTSWQAATQELKKARARHAKYFNKKAKERELMPGDRVLLLLPQGNSKLDIGWQGPYEVVSKKSRTNYTILIKGKERTYHINLLKKYNERIQTQNLMMMTVAQEVESTEQLGCDYPLKPLETYQDVTINPELAPQQQQEVKDILRQYQNALSDKPGRTDLVDLELTLTDDTPIRSKPYPVPLAKEHVIEEEISEMLKSGIISPSESPYSAPLLLLRKPNGDHRLCIDFRKLNSVIDFQPEPLPDQARLFAKVKHARYLSKLDLSSGYYQIGVPLHLRKYLAFSTHQAHYQFNVLPFGLHIAPSIFTRMMKKLIDPIGDSDIFHFMDDCLVASATWEEHTKSLARLLRRLQETGLTAKPSKCKMGFESIEFLGHILQQGTISPNEKNIEKMQNAPRPTTKKGIRSFVGMCGFYQKFIPNFNMLTAPLTELTKKASPEVVKWNPECETAFQTLKELLVSRPILQLPDLNRPFILRTDASGIGIAATLMQEDNEHPDILHPVAYASRKLNTAERNYSTVEQECLALIWGIDKFQLYLYGRHFKIQTDNQPMLFLATTKQMNAKLMRWSLILSQYSFTVEYIRSKDNHGADFLSRHPESEETAIKQVQGQQTSAGSNTRESPSSGTIQGNFEAKF